MEGDWERGRGWRWRWGVGKAVGWARPVHETRLEKSTGNDARGRSRCVNELAGDQCFCVSRSAEESEWIRHHFDLSEIQQDFDWENSHSNTWSPLLADPGTTFASSTTPPEKAYTHQSNCLRGQVSQQLQSTEATTSSSTIRIQSFIIETYHRQIMPHRLKITRDPCQLVMYETLEA